MGSTPSLDRFTTLNLHNLGTAWAASGNGSICELITTFERYPLPEYCLTWQISIPEARVAILWASEIMIFLLAELSINPKILRINPVR